MSFYRVIVLLCVFFSSIGGALFGEKAEDLTYDFLIKDLWTDHVQHFEKLFKVTKISSFLEFGIGYGTKYFIDNCEKVTSCEIIFPNQNADWYEKCLSLYKNFSNWTPILVYGSYDLLVASDRRSQGIEPSLRSSSYLLELRSICNRLFTNYEYDLAFVDPGFYVRADLVNELFNRVPIIAAHDTSYDPSVYGWNKIQTPDNYEKIVCSEGMGVTFWVRKDKENIISHLKSHIQNKKMFTQIYNEKLWGKSGSLSGPGSNLNQTAAIREVLPNILKKYNCRSIVDAACGDFFWMRTVDLDIDKYIGIDIVGELIQKNRVNFGNAKRSFIEMDIVQEVPPQADLIFCRDCLGHLSYRDIAKVINNFKKSKSTYLLATSFPNHLTNSNIKTGNWFPINLRISPFNFPEPLLIINEHCTESQQYSDKSLLLWKIDNLPNLEDFE